MTLYLVSFVTAAALSIQVALGAPGDPPMPPVSDPVVSEVFGLCEVHYTITLNVDGLADWAKANDPSKLVLFLNGVPFKGLTFAQDQFANNKTFCTLALTPDNASAWNTLLGRPDVSAIFGQHTKVRVTIGTDNHPFQTKNDPELELVAVDPAGFWIFVLLFLGFASLVVHLARQTSMVRDGPDDPNGTHKTFSLARVQMAFWFVLVVSAYGFIWLVTGAVDTITSSVLGLIGISSATGLAGIVVDNSKRTQATNDLAKLLTEQSSLQNEQRLAAASGNTLAADKVLRLQALPQEITSARNTAVPQATNTFLDDILSDASGVSVHRLQVAVWTVVLGIIFLVAVYNTLAMPQFSETLLGLMGISGGTYIGFKLPEKQ